jgi:release factor glutamine methyltransferase
LVAGKTGLEIIQKLVAGAGEFLRSGGYLIFEIGYDQKNAVLELFDPEWRKVECFEDLSGIPRVIIAQKK